MLILIRRNLRNFNDWNIYCHKENILPLNCFVFRVSCKLSSTFRIASIARMPYCTKCGEQKSKLNKNNLCRACANTNDTTENDDTLQPSDAAQNGSDFWKQMDRMFETKLNKFETSIKTAIMEDVDKLINPVKDDVNTLTIENTDLKAQVINLKTKNKHHVERIGELEKTAIQQQKYLVKNDKDQRLKRLLIAGVKEDTDMDYGDVTASNDDAKVMLLLNTMELQNIVPIGWRRVGSKDLETQQRPRFLMVEFNTVKERNEVKNANKMLK